MPTKAQVLGVVDDMCTAMYLDEQLGFKSHKTNHKTIKLDKSWQNNMFHFQSNMYINALKSSNIEFKKCDYLSSDSTKYNSMMVVSKKKISFGKDVAGT